MNKTVENVVEPVTAINAGHRVASRDPEDNNAQGVVTRVVPSAGMCRVLWDVRADSAPNETWCAVDRVLVLDLDA